MNNKKISYFLLMIIVLFTSVSCKQQDQLSDSNTSSTAIPTTTPLPPATLSEQKITFENVERTYQLRIPFGVDPTVPSPVVFIFHGMGEQASDMYKAGFNPIADQENIILVYPEIISHTSTDFIRAILLDVSDIVNVDQSRIYAMGFSLGGMLTYYTACEMSDIFAAFGACSGMALCENTPDSNNPVSIIHFHGLGDDIVPYDTGSFGMPPVEEAIEQWVQFDECASSPQVEKTGQITHNTYSDCRDGSDVELYIIEGLGHKVATREIPAAKVIWDFFKAHPMQ